VGVLGVTASLHYIYGGMADVPRVTSGDVEEPPAPSTTAERSEEAADAAPGRLRGDLDTILQKALRIYGKELGPAHRMTLVIRGNNFSTILRAQDNYAGAERVLREQFRAVRARYPADDIRVGKWAA
jgi:hypothetical protein